MVYREGWLRVMENVAGQRFVPLDERKPSGFDR
jgi:hypothetical protein